MPGIPQLHLPLVDVRDVATAHVAAMTVPQAAGKRFILKTEVYWYRELAEQLKALGYEVPTRVFPNWIVRIFGRFDPAAALIVPRLGKRRNLSNRQAKTLLDWKTRPMRQTIVDTAEDIASRMSS